MHWRNIYVQNPYPNQTPDRPRKNSKQYTPTRSENNQSRLIDSSFDKSRESSRGRKSLDVIKKIEENAPRRDKFVVSEQWLIKLKKQINNLIKYSHSICTIMRNYAKYLNDSLKTSTQTLREQIILKISQINSYIGLTNLPKIISEIEYPQEVSLVVPAENSPAKELIKPLKMAHCNFQQEFKTLSNISIHGNEGLGKNIKGSGAHIQVDIQNTMNKNSNTSIKKLAKQYNLQDKIVTIKKSCSIGVKMQLKSTERIDSKEKAVHISNLSKQKTSKQKQSAALTKAKQTIRQIQPQIAYIDPRGKKEKPTLRLKTTKEITTLQQILNPQQQKQEASKPILSQLQFLNNPGKHEKTGRIKTSLTERKLSSQSALEKDPKLSYSFRTNRQIDETMTKMTNCIDNMKKILSKPV